MNCFWQCDKRKLRSISIICECAFVFQSVCFRYSHWTDVMGLLTEGSPLTWEETEKYADHVRKHGIIQFIKLYHRLKDRQNDCLKWGDEVLINWLLVYLYFTELNVLYFLIVFCVFWILYFAEDYQSYWLHYLI